MGLYVLPENQGGVLQRIGRGLGAGLSSQLPQEVERQRLSTGLQNLAQNAKGLTPLEQYAQTAAIPGITPAMLQALPEILKQQNIRNSLANRKKGKASADIQQPSKLDVNFLNLPKGKKEESGKDQKLPSDFQTEEAEALSKPGNIRNPNAPELQPLPSLTPQQRDDEILDIMDSNPSLGYEGAKQLQADNERRRQEQPEFQQRLETNRKTNQAELDQEINNQLSTILHKESKDIFSDITGDMQLNIKKAAYNDLVTNPKLNIKTAAEKWVKKARNFVDQKNQVKVLAHRDFLDKLSPSKNEETIKKLQTAQKVFEETGNQKEFYDILRSSNSGENFGFGLSPGGAALIAYPRSEPVKSLIKKNEFWGNFPIHETDYKSRKFAEDLSKVVTSSDSFLAVAREMKNKNPYFNEREYFDWLRENRDKLGLNPRLTRELSVGESDVFPNWGDIALFPAFTKSVAND